MIKLAHARYSETESKNGMPGDQTGSEVSLSDFYDRPWKWFFRAKRTKLAECIARDAIIICNNDNIGYSQDTRYGLMNAWLTSDGDFAEIEDKANCDCSSFVATILIANHVSVSPYMTTANEKAEIDGTGYFYCWKFEDRSQLKHGDILLASGHTAIVVEPDKEPEEEVYTLYGDDIRRALTDVYIRLGPSPAETAIRVVREGEKVSFSNIAYFDWILVNYSFGGKISNGWTNGKYYESI